MYHILCQVSRLRAAEKRIKVRGGAVTIASVKQSVSAPNDPWHCAFLQELPHLPHREKIAGVALQLLQRDGKSPLPTSVL